MTYTSLSTHFITSKHIPDLSSPREIGRYQGLYWGMKKYSDIESKVSLDFQMRADAKTETPDVKRIIPIHKLKPKPIKA